MLGRQTVKQVPAQVLIQHWIVPLSLVGFLHDIHPQSGTIGMFSGLVEHLKNFIQIIAFNSDTIISGLESRRDWYLIEYWCQRFGLFLESWYFTALLINYWGLPAGGFYQLQIQTPD